MDPSFQVGVPASVGHGVVKFLFSTFQIGESHGSNKVTAQHSSIDCFGKNLSVLVRYDLSLILILQEKVFFVLSPPSLFLKFMQGHLPFEVMTLQITIGLVPWSLL